MRLVRMMKWLVIFTILLATTSIALAQVPTGTILGTVKDPSGTPVPDVSLTARNVETGQTRTMKSESDGAYRISALPVGSYEIKAEHEGFNVLVTNGITVTVAQEVVLDMALQIGAVSQSVSVTAQAPIVNTTNSALASLVDQQQISDLPLNGRNYLDLMLLQPGILSQTNKKAGGSQIGTWFSSNGAPVRSNNVLLDGASMIILLGANSSSASGSTMGIDGIKEWRVVTNSFSAEYGMTMGSQMLMASKGGSNQFHGDAFEYLRNSALDATNFFYVPVAANGFARIPPYKRNNFGGSFGGPIKKDKTFFYGVYEGLRERLGVTTVDTTIPAANQVTTSNPGCGGCNVPAVIQPILALFPAPNLPGSKYTFPYSQPTTEDYGQMRVDQNISDEDTLFVRYTIDNDSQVQTPTFPNFSKVGFISRGQFLTLSENHIISTSLLNSARFSFSRTNYAQQNPPVNITGPQFSFVTGRQMGTLSIGGFTAIGGDGATTPIQDFKQNIFAWSDDLYYTHGKHALKFGFLINHYQQFFIRGANRGGTLNFANLSHFLQGFPSSYNVQFPDPSIADRTYHNNTLGFYAQDDWRLRSNLTLNLGLRYEFATTYVETQGHSASFRNVATDSGPTVGAPYKNPSLRNFSPRVGFAWDVMGDGKTAVRGGFGMLYDVQSNGTALFIGSNIPPFGSSNSVSISSQNVLLSLPLVFPASSVGKSLGGVNYYLNQPYMLQYNLAVERQLLWNISLSVAYGGSRGVHLMKITEGNPTLPQIQSNGTPLWMPTCPTGTTTLTCSPRLNNAWSTYTMENAASSSNYNSLQTQLTKRMSNGLELQAVFTWAKSLDNVQGQASGETSSSPVFSSYPQNIAYDRGPSAFDIADNLRINAVYQFPDFHQKKGLLGNLLSGWGLNGILTVQTGYPFTPVIQSNRSLSGVNGGGGAAGSGSASADRPNFVPGRSINSITHGTSTGCTLSNGSVIAAGTPLGTPTLFLDPCAFTLQPTGTLGNVGRNILFGPGLNNIDFSVIKDIDLKFREGAVLEFRAEFFNLFNHPSFGTPAVGVGNSAAVIFAGTPADVTENPLPAVGVLNSTSTTNRDIQFGLKFIF